eukprot:TRINITY_DN1310_c0_g4_i1.p1 TRINITY_DN1310_c0_g4~~TRINITY_DN1310_c0_g4_i1.p1  ORF type:complete len:475 (-),score=114.93 TRINITY_DN1310_c0_g4_i1:33-1457(-)
MKKVIVKGKVAVDSYCPRARDCHVIQEGDEIYNCMLNQTNIAQNNNKFYVAQALESDKGGEYYGWTRWGRVGETGQNLIKDCGKNKQAAIKFFKDKFKAKSGNDWSKRHNFVSKPNLYTMVEIDYGADSEEPEKKKKEGGGEVSKTPRTQTASKLHDKVQDLVKLIFDLKMMESTMAEMEFDVKKSPLGKLTKNQIKKGYEILSLIEAAIRAGKSRSKLAQLSSDFYSLIPHSFGRAVPPPIETDEQLKKKMKMLEALGDIEIATKLMDSVGDDVGNKIDANYATLNTDIEPVDVSSDEYKEILKYVQNTHPVKTPTIKCLYRILRKGEDTRFEPRKTLGNRKLLWHGSRLTNYVGIISQGLRIAPPEAPVSGYRFGKGIYFADIMSLSSVYCRTGNSNDFCMLLGDVALGKESELNKDTYMEKAQPGFDSTKAIGVIEPDRSSDVVHPDGYIIPNGKIVSTGKTRGEVSCNEH